MNTTHARRVYDFQQIARVPLLAVLEHLGVLGDLRPVGTKAFVGQCPICRAASKKAFNITVKDRQLWKCFDPRHDSGGDALSFVREYERVDLPEAAALIASWFAIDVREFKPSQRLIERRREMPVASSHNKPTHKVYSSAPREGQKDFLTRIGSAWPFQTKDGKSGLSIQLTAMPIADRIVLFEYDAEVDGEAEDKKPNGKSRK